MLDKFKNILILGLGKSGIATAYHLASLGLPITVNDGKQESDHPFSIKLRELNIPCFFGGHPISLLDEGIDLIVKSPGIPYSNPILQEAQERNIPIVTEIEIGYQLTDSSVIGITGSNGKTTTTSLVGEIFKEANKKSEVCGNIGTPFLEVACEKNDFLITELSSFQLKGILDFKPKISAFLNFSETHMDFHGTSEDYFDSKKKIFSNQDKNDYAILNADEPLFNKIEKEIKSKVYKFSFQNEVEKGVFIKNNSIFFKNSNQLEEIIHLSEITLKGNHNIENILAAVLISKLANINKEDIKNAIIKFKAIEHRLEPVRKINGTWYYNDSKSTNPVSTIKACSSFTEPIVLIVGGKDRGTDLSILKETFKSQNIKKIIAFGETKDSFEKVLDLNDKSKISFANDIEEAVKISNQVSSSGDVVLLSPACASWGMYPSYIERGNHFKKIINETL